MSLRESLENRRFIVFGGKGGQGKTAFSAATALQLATQGKKVLVFSADPQAGLSDIFERDLYGKGAVEILPGLHAQELDPTQLVRVRQEETRQKILARYNLLKLPDEIEDYIRDTSAEPGMEESAIFDAVGEIVAGGQYDIFVYDLLPLEHALYHLGMAGTFSKWAGKMSAFRIEMQGLDRMAAVTQRSKTPREDEVLTELQAIQQRISASASILTDPGKTAFFFVLTPEEMALQDTLKAAAQFARFNVPVAGYMINRLLPVELGSRQNLPAGLRGQLAVQGAAMERIERAIGGQVVAHVPELERDVIGLEMLEKLAAAIFGGAG